MSFSVIRHEHLGAGLEALDDDDTDTCPWANAPGSGDDSSVSLLV